MQRQLAFASAYHCCGKVIDILQNVSCHLHLLSSLAGIKIKNLHSGAKSSSSHFVGLDVLIDITSGAILGVSLKIRLFYWS